MINHKRDIALHICADVAAAGLPAVGGGVTCAVPGKVGDAVPDPEDLREIDDAERDGNNDASSEDGVFNSRLPTRFSAASTHTTVGQTVLLSAPVKQMLYYRRHLPHWYPDNVPVFVSWR